MPSLSPIPLPSPQAALVFASVSAIKKKTSGNFLIGIFFRRDLIRRSPYRLQLRKYPLRLSSPQLRCLHPLPRTSLTTRYEETSVTHRSTSTFVTDEDGARQEGFIVDIDSIQSHGMFL
jgi:hypothetical protein